MVIGFRIAWRTSGVVKIIITGRLTFILFLPRFESKVSGVSVQDMLVRQSFLTPET
jgi:hypothetical protein